MIGFILTGHGEFAPGLASALELVAGRQEGFKVVPFDVDKAADYPELIHSEIAAMREQTDGVVVFCDLLGGTPFNQAMMASQSTPDVEIVVGANLPMLIETLFARSSDANATIGSLVECAVNAGKNGVDTRKFEACVEDEDDE